MTARFATGCSKLVEREQWAVSKSQSGKPKWVMPGAARGGMGRNFFIPLMREHVDRQTPLRCQIVSGGAREAECYLTKQTGESLIPLG